ncbi:DedA family protein [Roseomonas sp. PWR1]|uniref:DedA family protein n=1 Tax=Roseomonas nitratireducens TaxID=2820810 RepID=A0ABS4AU51_9PROT|nr:DedA family protein [Neoroseomonas nitratireducens]MBP0464884.1 DedA family protein [Neoroseomonas nitratireducens]
MAEIWAEWGNLAYLAAALWAFFEGETFVLAAAAIGATVGLVDPWILMASVWIGSYCGDQTWFYLGRRYGPAILRRFPGQRPKVEKAERLLDQYGTLFILSFRFLYGIRNVASVVCGLAGYNWARFAVLNFIAAGLWAGSFVAAGWFLGAWLGVERLFWTICGIALCALAFFVIRHFRIRAREKAAARASG